MKIELNDPNNQKLVVIENQNNQSVETLKQDFKIAIQALKLQTNKMKGMENTLNIYVKKIDVLEKTGEENKKEIKVLKEKSEEKDKEINSLKEAQQKQVETITVLVKDKLQLENSVNLLLKDRNDLKEEKEVKELKKEWAEEKNAPSISLGIFGFGAGGALAGVAGGIALAPLSPLAPAFLGGIAGIAIVDGFSRLGTILDASRIEKYEKEYIKNNPNCSKKEAYLFALKKDKEMCEKWEKEREYEPDHCDWSGLDASYSF